MISSLVDLLIRSGARQSFRRGDSTRADLAISRAARQSVDSLRADRMISPRVDLLIRVLRRALIE